MPIEKLNQTFPPHKMPSEFRQLTVRGRRRVVRIVAPLDAAVGEKIQSPVGRCRFVTIPSSTDEDFVIGPDYCRGSCCGGIFPIAPIAVCATIIQFVEGALV